MQINISNTSSEVESLRQIIATLTDQNQDLSEQNNNWSLKYQQLEQEKSKLASSNSELLVNHISLNTRYSALESNNTELLQKNTELSNYIALLEERLRLIKSKRFGKSSEKLEHQIDLVERLLEEEEALLGVNLKPSRVSSSSSNLSTTSI